MFQTSKNRVIDVCSEIKVKFGSTTVAVAEIFEV